jgi:hypothetical protein
MIQTGVPPFAVAHAAAERRLLRRLHEMGATSAARAQAVEGLSGLEKRRLGRLLRAGALREPEPGKYYVDAAGLESYLNTRRIRAAFIITGVIVVLAVLWGVVRR